MRRNRRIHSSGSIDEWNSPVSIRHRSDNRTDFSIDLDEPPEVVEGTGPNLAVIEELEEIRDMIESQSRELIQREMFLNQSYDQIHFEKVSVLESVENEFLRLLAQGEKRLEEAHLVNVRRMETLIRRVEIGMNDLKQLKSKLIIAENGKNVSCVPPLPQPEVSTDVQSSQILGFISQHSQMGNNNIRTNFIASASLLILKRVLDEYEQTFVINSATMYMVEYINREFHKYFLSSLQADSLSMAESDFKSKFEAVQRELVLKRLSVPPIRCYGNVEVHVQEISVGNTDNEFNSIDLNNELACCKELRDLLKRLPVDKLPNNLKQDRLFDFFVGADSICGRLGVYCGRKISDGSILFHVAKIALSGGTSDDEIGHITRLMKSSETSSLDRFRVFQLGLYLAHTLKFGRVSGKFEFFHDSLSVTSVVALMRAGVAAAPDITHYLRTWTQGLWYMLKLCVHFQAGSGVLESEIDLYFGLIEQVRPRELIAAWTPVMVERIQKKLLCPMFSSRIKSLIRDN